MRTKFIKVSTADRLPEKDGWQIVLRKNEIAISSYYFTTILSFANDDAEFWLEEKPDHEDEMREMLEELNNSIDEQDTSIGISSDLNDAWVKIQTLLTKIKES